MTDSEVTALVLGFQKSFSDIIFEYCKEKNVKADPIYIIAGVGISMGLNSVYGLKANHVTKNMGVDLLEAAIEAFEDLRAEK